MADTHSKPITPDEIRALADRLDGVELAGSYVIDRASNSTEEREASKAWDKDIETVNHATTLLRVLAAIAERCDEMLTSCGEQDCIRCRVYAQIAALITGEQP